MGGAGERVGEEIGAHGLGNGLEKHPDSQKTPLLAPEKGTATLLVDKMTCCNSLFLRYLCAPWEGMCLFSHHAVDVRPAMSILLPRFDQRQQP